MLSRRGGNNWVLGDRIFYKESCFSEDIIEKEMKGADSDSPMKKWNDQDQYQLYHE